MYPDVSGKKTTTDRLGPNHCLYFLFDYLVSKIPVKNDRYFFVQIIKYNSSFTL